jgi:hypothetical protein
LPLPSSLMLEERLVPSGDGGASSVRMQAPGSPSTFGIRCTCLREWAPALLDPETGRAKEKSMRCKGAAIAAAWIFVAAGAVAATPGGAGSRQEERGNPNTPAADQKAPAMGQEPRKEQAPPRVQGAVEADMRQGVQACAGLADQQARVACEARAAATAEIPRGREGADPTGTGNPPKTR